MGSDRIGKIVHALGLIALAGIGLLCIYIGFYMVTNAYEIADALSAWMR